MSSTRQVLEIIGDLLGDLDALAERWDEKYTELRGGRMENESWEDEADDMVADTYSDCAGEVRKLVIDARARL